MLPIRNPENEGINNDALSLSVLMPKQQKSLVSHVIPKGVKKEIKEEYSKVSIKNEVDIKDEVSSRDDVFPSVNNIQVMEIGQLVVQRKAIVLGAKTNYKTLYLTIYFNSSLYRNWMQLQYLMSYFI